MIGSETVALSAPLARGLSGATEMAVTTIEAMGEAGAAPVLSRKNK